MARFVVLALAFAATSALVAGEHRRSHHIKFRCARDVLHKVKRDFAACLDPALNAACNRTSVAKPTLSECVQPWKDSQCLDDDEYRSLKEIVYSVAIVNVEPRQNCKELNDFLGDVVTDSPSGCSKQEMHESFRVRGECTKNEVNSSDASWSWDRLCNVAKHHVHTCADMAQKNDCFSDEEFEGMQKRNLLFFNGFHQFVEMGEASTGRPIIHKCNVRHPTPQQPIQGQPGQECHCDTSGADATRALAAVLFSTAVMALSGKAAVC